VIHYILDGHNILHQDPGVKRTLSSDPSHAINGLISRSHRFIAGKSNKCTICFDGHPPGDINTNIKNIQVTFSYNRDADSLIKSLIARSNNPKNIVVISDDTEIQRFARVHSCGIISTSQFLNQRRFGPEQDSIDKPDTDDLSIQEWLQLFKNNDK